MWVMLNHAFLSIVQHRTKKNKLLVRARHPDHITSVFPNANVARTDFADYRFRAVISYTDVSRALHREVRGIDYENFKNSVADKDLHDAYMRVWNVFFDYQHRERLEGGDPFEIAHGETSDQPGFA